MIDSNDLKAGLDPRWVSVGCLLVALVACHGSPSADRAPAPVSPAPTVASAPAAPQDPPPTQAARAGGQAAYDQGYELAMAGDFHAALALFRKATELDPTLAVAWFDLAGLTEQLGDTAAARVAMERCVAVEPAFIQARVELATMYFEDRAAAMLQLRKALTEPAPYVIDRYSAAHSRGEGLHKVAVAYLSDFPAAARRSGPGARARRGRTRRRRCRRAR